MTPDTEMQENPTGECLPHEREADALELQKPADDSIPGPSQAPEPAPKDVRTTASPPYVKPAWSAPPEHPFVFEVIREGSIVATLDV